MENVFVVTEVFIDGQMTRSNVCGAFRDKNVGIDEMESRILEVFGEKLEEKWDEVSSEYDSYDEFVEDFLDEGYRSETIWSIPEDYEDFLDGTDGYFIMATITDLR